VQQKKEKAVGAIMQDKLTEEEWKELLGGDDCK
jgi:hypothetical protein